MSARNGKIANLPNDIREQLNLRLLEGETAEPFGVGAGGMSRKEASELAAWLNALPEVQSVLASQFKGAPISEVNLTLWRQGGYLQWLTERECFDSARALADGDCDLAKTGLSAERWLNVLTVRLGQLLMRWDTSPDEGASDEPIGIGAGGMSRREASSFSLMARKARILQGISRAVLVIHRIQSQSAGRKSEPATSSASSHATPENHTSNLLEQALVARSREKRASQPEMGPFASPAVPEPAVAPAVKQSAEPIGRGAGGGKEKGEPIRNQQSSIPKILSGPIAPPNTAGAAFKPKRDLIEALGAA